jgi:hypothetical protein
MKRSSILLLLLIFITGPHLLLTLGCSGYPRQTMGRKFLRVNTLVRGSQRHTHWLTEQSCLASHPISADTKLTPVEVVFSFIYLWIVVSSSEGLFGSVANFRYVGTAKSRITFRRVSEQIKFWYTCCHSVQNLLTYCLPSNIPQIKICWTVTLILI